MRPMRRRKSRLKPQPGMYTDLPASGRPEQSAQLPEQARPANDEPFESDTEQHERESEKAFEEALTRTPP